MWTVLPYLLQPVFLDIKPVAVVEGCGDVDEAQKLFNRMDFRYQVLCESVTSGALVIRGLSSWICDMDQGRSDSNTVRILSTRVLNTGSDCVASVIFSML